MRPTYDITNQEDALIVGHLLQPILGTVVDGRPTGAMWEAIDQLRHHLERRAFEAVERDARLSPLARVLGRLTGGLFGKLPPGEAEYARLSGKLEGLREMQNIISTLALVAIGHKAAEADKAAESKQKRQLQATPLGRSTM